MAVTECAKLRAPFPYIGSKRAIAGEVWKRLGDPDKYIEPFAGSLAVLLSRPHPPNGELVNDSDGLLCNAWRAIKYAPKSVCKYAEWPRSELDLHARHRWLVGERESITESLRSDPEFFDARAAGWWVWGACCWIGGGWGKKSRVRQRPDTTQKCVTRQRVDVKAWMASLSERLRNVDVWCGDWSRAVTKAAVRRARSVAVFFDPPYSHSLRDSTLYANESSSVSSDVVRWAIEHGDDPRFRIALCGFEDEHEMPSDWECFRWSTQGGYGNTSRNGQGRGLKNMHRERVWFSPHCLKKGGLFESSRMA